MFWREERIKEEGQRGGGERDSWDVAEAAQGDEEQGQLRRKGGRGWVESRREREREERGRKGKKRETLSSPSPPRLREALRSSKAI